MLKELDVNGKDLELINNLYWQQRIAVRAGQDMSDWVNIRRGVRFSLYTQMIMRKINHMCGLKL